MSSSENTELVDTLQRLFFGSLPTVQEMTQRLAEEGVRGIGVSRMDLLTREKGPQDFVVARLGAYYIDSEGRIFVDDADKAEAEMDDFLSMREMEGVIGARPPYGRLNIGNFRNSGLRRGKISPYDLLDFPTERFRLAICMVSPDAARVARWGERIILPVGYDDFIVPLMQEVIDTLGQDLSARGWFFKVMDYHEWEKPDSFSPHI